MEEERARLAAASEVECARVGGLKHSERSQQQDGSEGYENLSGSPIIQIGLGGLF